MKPHIVLMIIRILDSMKSFFNSLETFAIWNAINPKPAIATEIETTKLIISGVSFSLNPPKNIIASAIVKDAIISIFDR